MKKIFNLIGIFTISILFLTGCASKDDSSKYNIDINADENIEVKTYVDFEKDYLILYLTNNNSYNIGCFDVEAIFYDDNDNKIGEDDVSSNLDFISGGNYVVTIDLPEDEDYNGYVPEKVEISVKVDQEYQDIVGEGNLYNDKVETSYKKVGDEIEISLTNNSNVDLTTVEIAILFMKNDKPIYVEELSGSFDIGESDSESIDIPEDWEASEKLDEDVLINYDEIEIVVNRATAD